MEDYNTLNQFVGIAGLVLSIVSLLYALNQTKVFSKGIKITALLHVRSLINRMEEDKKDHERNSPQWKTMHDTQQQLETLFKGLQTTFKISDRKAPR